VVTAPLDASTGHAHRLVAGDDGPVLRCQCGIADYPLDDAASAALDDAERAAWSDHWRRIAM
jgi:hypothetical protein